MISETKHIISKAIHDLSQLNVNDVLVNALGAKFHEIDNSILQESIEVPIDASISSIFKKANEFKKETGTNPLCLAVGFLQWEIKSKEVHTPILLIPLKSKLSKINQTIQFESSLDEGFMNPFLSTYFANEFDVSVPNFEGSTDFVRDFIEWLNSTSIPFQFNLKQLIGNFHHHRFQILKDLEGLLNEPIIGNNVEQILGNEEKTEDSEFILTDDNLFPADNDQLNIFGQIQHSNTVIQGPPGTGKSQVLTNVLGKIIGANFKALVVSEKRVALEVLQNKLAQFQLDDFTFITTSETVSHDFILSLKKTWERMETSSILSRPVNLKLSEQHLQNLQIQIDLLNQKELIGGVSYDEFLKQTASIDFSKSEYISDIPTVKSWLIDEEIITEIYRFQLQESLRFLPFESVKNDVFLSFDSKLIAWKKEFKSLQNCFTIHTKEDVNEAMKQSAICQIIENELDKSYFLVLNPESKEQKKYNYLKKRRLSLNKKIESFQEEIKNWKIEPSENETIHLLEALKSSSFFIKRKAKKRLSQLTQSSFVDPVSALTKWIEFIQVNKELSQLQIEFSEIGVNSIDFDISNIDLFIQQMNKKEWEIYTSISSERRKKLCEFHSKLHQFHSVLKTYFKLKSNDLISEVFEKITIQFEELIRLRAKICSIENSSFRLLEIANSEDEYAKLIYKSNWVKFESYFPELAKFSPSEIHSKVNQIIFSRDEESKLFSHQIEFSIQEKFQEFHHLLRTPSQKLSAQEKEKKQRLKKGKSILVKEFSKSKSHPSIRELLESEAAIWIHLLKPIWLSNPVQVARCFPLKKDFFDFIIFDEATQIPLVNALGSLHRGKRIIVAGDEQQMSPSSYFQSTSETVDLLHQAGFYWKNLFLKHHYRSEHPALIEFSNRHFYTNSLIAYPSVNSTNYPIQLHYCENGIFDERENEQEAKMIAKLLEEKLKLNQSIGVVAFSETQLNCIYRQLSPSIQLKMAERIDEGTLFFKSLENVQGEECDALLISFGYGKNDEGEFHLRFGPLNQKSGSKRLNVLLTRAKKSIDFVSSVQSKEFKISENESVNLVRLFLLQIEEQKSLENKSIQFPFGLNPNISEVNNSKMNIQFPYIYKTINDANELVTFQYVLQNRGWKLV